MIIYKAFKFRLYPNLEQRQALERHFGCTRFVFNTFLKERMEYYAAHKREAKKGLNYYDTVKLLTALKRKTEYEWLKEVNSQSLHSRRISCNGEFIKASNVKWFLRI